MSWPWCSSSAQSLGRAENRSVLIFLKATRERAGPPSVVGYREAVLGRQLHPHALLASQVRGRMGAGADRGAGDVDDAVEVIAQEGRDPQGPRELVRRAQRDAADYQALRAQDEERAR